MNSSILCSIQRALIGNVTQNLRAVYIDFNNDVLSLIFYYDKTP